MGFKNIIIDHHENFLKKAYFLKPIVYIIYLTSKLANSHFFATAGIKTTSRFYPGIIIRNIPSKEAFKDQSVEKKDIMRRDLSIAYIGNLSEMRQIKKLKTLLNILTHKKDFSLTVAGPIKDQVANVSINRLKKYSSFSYYDWADDKLKKKILNQANFGFSLHDGQKNRNLKNSEPTKVWEYLCTNTFVIMSEVENFNEIYSPQTA